uniref:HECT domain-containing protein n=1 Tax=Branchiostoma floridae TaxID=7739 RepID=C3Y5X6_BRAFL|eukprot:XP_002608363.1 hypothetical protein BRAFLDRAFT_91322 [Branchiostoma floridae]
MTSNRNCGKCGKKCDNCNTPGAVPSTSSLGKAKNKGKHPVKYKDWGSRDPRDSSDSDDEEFQRIFKDNKKKTEYKRKQYFDTAGTKKKKTKNLDDVIVTMSILRRNVTTNNLTTVYDSGIGVKVPVFASASIIQEETERKLRALRKIVSSDGKHVLTNKDGVWLKFIPGTKEQFTLQKYKELRGLPGSKIHLYLLPVRDYLAVQKNAKERRDPHWKEARDFLDHPFEDTCKKTKQPNPDYWEKQSQQLNSYICVESEEEPYPEEESGKKEDDNPDNLGTSRSQSEMDRQLSTLLKGLNKERIQQDEKVYFVKRTKVWSNMRARIQLPSFDPSLKVKVKFIGEEEAQDGGGPRSEMLRLAIHQLYQSDLFLQTADGYVPTCGSLSLNRDDYVAVGQLFALSLVQLGPAPHGMHPVITQALCGKSHTQIEVLGEPAVEDAMTSIFLDKLTAVSSHDDLKRFLQEDRTLDILQMVQWTIPVGKMTMKDVPTLKRVVILHDLIFKRKPAIEQMREGLGTLGILGHMDEDPSLFQGVFSHKKEGLEPDDLMEQCNVIFANQGSNRYEAQTSIIEKFTLWLEEVKSGEHDGVKVRDVMVFMTGAECEPPAGWPVRPMIQFSSCEKGCSCFATANTCTLTLKLPEHLDDLSQPQFSSRMTDTIKEGWGFDAIIDKSLKRARNTKFMRS